MADKNVKADQIGVRITPATRERLEKVAKQEDRSISFIVNRLIEKYLDTEFSKPKSN
jgi:predicted DNA-binding protein